MPKESMTDVKTEATETESWLEQALTKRHALSSDPHRPRYHFAAPAGWLNDPNGIIRWNGEYHLFYQHNPVEARWGPPHWGHAVSRDLVHWEDRPVALTPEMRPVDAGGCWSGCAVDDDGTPTFLYTGVRDTNLGEQTTCLATGDDTLTNWQKFDNNPLVRTPTDLGITHKSYRDPYVWREGDTWYQVIGTSIGGRGQALLYRSEDLRSWEYLNPLVSQELRATFDDECHTWECVNFFKLEDQHVLIVSLATDKALTYPIAFIGHYQDQQFYPKSVQRVDWGYHGFYAPLAMRDDGGRRLMWGWLQEQRAVEAQLQAGWSGIMSLPRVLTFEEGKLCTRFAPELEILRRQEMRIDDLSLDGEHLVAGLEASLELQVTFTRDRATRSGLRFAYSSEETLHVFVDWEAEQFVIDRQNLGIEPSMSSPVQHADFEALGETVRLHLYLDGSALELVADDHLAMSARLYPDDLNQTRVQLVSDGKAKAALKGWALASIYT